MKCHVSALGHITKGCVSDPEGVPMYKDVSSLRANIKKYLCYRGTSALEGFHRWLRGFTSAVYLSPELMNALLHEFMSRWNAKAGIKNDSLADFGHFANEVLDEIADVVEPHVGPSGYFHTNPLCADGVMYVKRRANNGDTFGLTPMIEAAQSEIRKALAHDDDGDLVEFDVEVEEDFAGPSGETDGAAGAPRIPSVSENGGITALRPLKEARSVALLQQMYKKMYDERHGSIDWALLQSWYNNQVGLMKTDKDVLDEVKQQYVFANESQLRSAFATLSEAALQKKLLSGSLMEECQQLQAKLKKSAGTHFPPAVLSGVPSSSASSSSSSAVASSSSSSAVADNAMAITGGSAHVGDLMQYHKCVRPKVCKLNKGQWTKELLEQRLDVLCRVRWCLYCGEVCQVRSDKDANWSDAEIIGNCHRGKKINGSNGNGSAYPECKCKKTGEWKSFMQTDRMREIRKTEIRKIRRQIVKFASAAGHGSKKKRSKK
jgi:hypothetical protein